ncbi:unnamed protein product [Adineta steineri]|uniref:IRG-type G domain-containing protein n=1 Tax=Adineta steineri TaxID=433720 RepID=A0A813ZEF1_9BILA|nr:unnamed protein product [Adineta steineri]CAF0898306.1 unnamed protein product [Adineta steineri]CAF1035989.1 unnamed protein product [Adineta steineri]CAF1051163.1 unnamed protein product [Adineta steineri]CAF3845877.1 unnamed protein product [Adineta steineri]
MATSYDVKSLDYDLIDLSEDDKLAAQKYLSENGIRGIEGFLAERLDAWRKCPLNIAITGDSGAGKSTLINTLRNLRAEDEGAAKVGVVETTRTILSYSHPSYPNLVFYDLPGVGTLEFKKSTYLNQVNLSRYDFFLIISRTRFTENDLWLATEIQKIGKHFFFIRTNIDQDLYNEKIDHPKTYNETLVLDRIRENCLAHIRTVDETANAFLISGRLNYTSRFDFPLMCSSLLRDYPGLKRQAMILAMSSNCKEVIRAKVDILRGQTWVAAAVSAAVASPPIPGLSIMFDFSLTVGFVIFYKKQLGLDDESLARIAEIHHIPVYVIQDELQKILPAHFFTAVPDFVVSLVKRQAVGTATEEVLRYVPYVGSAICATVSFTIILSVLRNLLNVMEKAALTLIDIVAERSVSDDEDDDEPI